MVQSKAATVEEYLSELDPERREAISRVRMTILEHLPEGYEEAMNWGMISYQIPLEDYPDTYNKQPLMYAALGAQKNHYALYLMGVYQDPEKQDSLKEGFRHAGKKLDIGKSCVRFKKLEDLPLDVIGSIISSIPTAEFISRYEASRRRSK